MPGRDGMPAPQVDPQPMGGQVGGMDPAQWLQMYRGGGGMPQGGFQPMGGGGPDAMRNQIALALMGRGGMGGMGGM
jgi:hypothetical protein